MNIIQRVEIDRLLEERKGQSSHGEWTMGLWLVKSVVSGKKVSVSAFGEMNAKIAAMSKDNLIIDCEIAIEAKEYNGRWYNNFTVVNIIGENNISENDTPDTSVAVVADIVEDDDENVLPF